MVADWVAHWAAEGFRALETNLLELDAPGAAGCCFGQRPTIADIFIVPHLQAMRRNKVDLAPYTRLLAVEAACMALPAFQAAMPERQPDYPG